MLNGRYHFLPPFEASQRPLFNALEQGGFRDGGEPGAASRPQHAIDGVVVQVGAAPSAAGAVAVGKHLHDRLEVRA